MYVPQDVFQHISEHFIGFLITGSLCMIFAVIWYVESIRVAQRDRVISMPMLTTFAWFGHDLSYVLKYDDWFNKYNFWFFEGFWGFMVLLVIIEVVWIAQILTFGRREFFPKVSPGLFAAGVIAGLIASTSWWLTLKWNLDDPLYIISMGLTVMFYAATSISLTMRRGSQLGQSMLQLMSAALMMATFSFFTIFWLGDEFRDPRWVVMVVATTAWCVLSSIVWFRAPKLPATVA